MIDFNNKSFSLIDNSANGTVNHETTFLYKQDGTLVTADYYGGSIKYGKIIALLEGNQLNMLYQCITTDNEMKAGKAIADISITPNNKIKLKLHWEWLGDKQDKGTSEYLED